MNKKYIVVIVQYTILPFVLAKDYKIASIVINNTFRMLLIKLSIVCEEEEHSAHLKTFQRYTMCKQTSLHLGLHIVLVIRFSKSHA